MKSLTVFPYQPDFDILMRYQDMLRGHKIRCLASFKENKAILDRIAHKYSIECTTDLFRAAETSDAVLLLDNVGNMVTRDYQSVIQLASQMGKEVLLSPKLYAELDVCSETCTLLQNFYMQEKDYVHGRMKKQITVPVIGVLGLGESCSKFELQLSLYRNLIERGYHPAVFCTNTLGSLFGMYTLPPFLFANDLSFEDKILEFNYMLFKMQKHKEPDQFVIGFPSGIMPLGYNDEFNHFAEVPLILGNAVTCDSGILSIYFPDWINDDYLADLGQYCFNKFNVPIDAFFLAKQKLDYSLEFEKHSVLYLNDEFIDKHYPNLMNVRHNIIDAYTSGAEYTIPEFLDEIEMNPISI